MGQIVKQVSPNTTRYYWYPGEKREWFRAVVALAIGGAMLGTVYLSTDCTLAAVVTGASMTAAVGGVNFGRRDARALARLPDPLAKGARRAAVAHAGRAAWRALVEGIGAASAAVLVVNLPTGGATANWLLPLVPAVVGALAHQAGMLYERLGHVSAPASSLRPVLKPATLKPATKQA